jgi:hypothetical protein
MRLLDPKQAYTAIYQGLNTGKKVAPDVAAKWLNKKFAAATKKSVPTKRLTT